MKHKILSVLYSVSIFVLICLGSCKKEPPTRAYAGEVGRINEQPKTAAFSVRCIQD
ncbi:MAG: hypothetical protein ACOC4B_03340 [Bacteroidota bacterium]